MLAEFIPANRDHILIPETAKAWCYLEHNADKIAPWQSCDVGPLIGYNCPQALVPRQVVAGEENEPFTQRTDLSWSVVGYGNPGLDFGDAFGISHQVIMKQVIPFPPNLPSEVLDICRTRIKEVVSPTSSRCLNLILSKGLQRMNTFRKMIFGSCQLWKVALDSRRRVSMKWHFPLRKTELT